MNYNHWDNIYSSSKTKHKRDTSAPNKATYTKSRSKVQNKRDTQDNTDRDLSADE